MPANSPVETVDTIINACWIVPVVPNNQLLTDHSLVVHDGKIKAILPTEKVVQRYCSDRVVDCSAHLLIPGLVNSHTHAPMSLMRGLADDLPLQTWLEDHIWPAEQAHVSTEFVAAGSRLAIAEMICSGTTCFADMYFFPNITASIAEQAGMRAVIGLVLIDFPNSWAATPEEHLRLGLQLHDQYVSSPLITTQFAPHSAYTVSDQWLEQVATPAEELDLPITIHIHETAAEVEQSQTQHKMRPLERISQLGLLSSRLQAVHATQLLPDEIETLAQHGASVVHCPQSNMKLASGACPVNQLLNSGVNVSLGTDGAASNNNLNMVEEMRCAGLLGKLTANDAAALPAHTLLEMATINGARALGLDQQIGSLEPGKAADITAIRLDTLHTVPVFDPLSALIYASGRDNVTDVWVAGRQLLKDGELLTLHPPTLIKQTAQWRRQLQS
ncbi:MAG: TRZ/ATZ family hydrolase [Immundisolibacteraceae bacterium]|nr:TRZ/ATZ family hydrolase [Immundisolibacteraceae bacterium]